MPHVPYPHLFLNIQGSLPSLPDTFTHALPVDRIISSYRETCHEATYHPREPLLPRTETFVTSRPLLSLVGSMESAYNTPFSQNCKFFLS